MEYFAHAGEQHEATSESVLHVLENPLFASVVFVVGLVIVGYAVYRLFRRSVMPTLLVLCAVLLIIGFGSYSISATISILSLSVGIVSCMAVVLYSLTNEGGSK